MDFNQPQKNNKNNKNNKDKKPKETKHLEISETNYSEQDLEYFDYIVELPLFPVDFHMHKGNKRVTDDEINDWIEECVVALESDKSESYATAQSGDTKLVILRVHDDEENYHYVCEIFRERYSVEIYPEEL